MSVRIPVSDLPRVVVIGGGFGGIEFCKHLDTTSYQLVLIDRHNYHTFQPLLYQVATAGLEPSSIAGPLRKLFEHKPNFYFRMGEVLKIHPARNCIQTSLGALSYDYLVIASGSQTSFFGQEANFVEVYPLKELPDALSLRNSILQNFEDALLTDDPMERRHLMSIVIVGAGPTGVEIAGALSELRKHVLPKDYPELDFNEMKIFLIEGVDRVLSSMSPLSSADAFKHLLAMGIEVKVGKRVVRHNGKEAVLNDGTTIPCKTMVWAAGVTGSLIEGLPPQSVVRGNRLLVDAWNRVEGCANIFAIGDVAAMITPDNPSGHPQLAPVAIQQGRQLAENLNRVLHDEPMRPFRYRHKGTMATIGRNKAVADLPGRIHLKGFLAWLAWMGLHLIQLIGFRNRIVVLVNWIWNYVTYDRSIRLILRAKK
ncbi:MAG: NADH dehydrogenase [Chitinophagales bacterium]|nr:MAG: NADH dehydrogenase [Chitinophagales bacterium]